MNTQKHSPLPWHTVDHIIPVMSVECATGEMVTTPRYKDVHGRCEADLNLICLAVNSHQTMLDALRQWQQAEKIGDPEELENARRSRDAAIRMALEEDGR